MATWLRDGMAWHDVRMQAIEDRVAGAAAVDVFPEPPLGDNGKEAYPPPYDGLPVKETNSMHR